ncbi:hypothetical protein ES703_91814 [subsurface metagenome]
MLKVQELLFPMDIYTAAGSVAQCLQKVSTRMRFGWPLLLIYGTQRHNTTHCWREAVSDGTRAQVDEAVGRLLTKWEGPG